VQPVQQARVPGGSAATEEGLGLGGEPLVVPAIATATERSFSTFAPSLVSAAPSHLLQLVALERAGIELVSSESPQFVMSRFSVAGRSEIASVEELQRTLRSTAFSNQLDRLRDDVQKELEMDKSVTISVAGVSLGLSLVYVLWLIRGGVLVGSYLSALPAWRVLDPLPVLSRVDEEAEEDDEALDAVSAKAGDPLRGFG
jgi:hypothetical protein